VARYRRAAVAIGLLASCGDGGSAAPIDVCAATREWQTAMAEATNDFTRASRDLTDAGERREAYLAALDELRSLTDDLVDDVGERDAAVRDALGIAVELLDDARLAAEALGDDAYEVRRVPGGSLFTASERARATVLSAARPAC
jgi:hypothetical protein